MDELVLYKVQQALKGLISEQVLSLNEANNDDINLSFVAPDSEYVAELGNKPAINCYLIGITEDRNRRLSEPMRSEMNASNSKHLLYKEPKYVDITYMLTVWSKDKQGGAQVEHLLMGYLVCGLGRFDYLPEGYQQLHDIAPSPYGVRMTLFGSEHSEKISGQVWQAMGSTPKPTLMMSLSVPVMVHEPMTLPVVKEIERALKKSN